MKVHHLNTATMCPLGGRLVSGRGKLTEAARMVCHCLLLETPAGLVLVDAGLGMRDVTRPETTVGRDFVLLTRAKLDPEETALRQVEALGFSQKDVRHVVLTHLDLDHAGGIRDFPEAVVHVSRDEKDAALGPRTRIERKRYQQAHWEHGPKWAAYRPQGEPWFGFECVRNLDGLPPEILLIPLVGHSRGHAGVAVDTGAGWLLHAGDAYFNRGEMDPDRRRCPPFLDYFQRILEIDGRMRLKNQERLRVLARENAGEVRVFCAHDPVELERARERGARAGG
jgi:glyoxylase-like metal-dependent hydrolase (beta-lactamase superfamily II)